MADFPIEIITLILAFLPVKSLLRFKCVSKSWYSLITSPHFCILQLNHGGHHDRLLVACLKPGCINSNLNNHTEPSFMSNFMDSNVFIPATSLALPPQHKRTNAQICGSSNGLIAIIQDNITDRFLSLLGNCIYEVILWNPMINNYFLVPHVGLPAGLKKCVSFGFGHDSSSNDYKVVRITGFRVRKMVGDRYSCCFVLRKRQIMVYSLNKQSWRVLSEEFVEDNLVLHKYGALINNHILHWIFFEEANRIHKLRGFDVCSEEWFELPLPNFFEFSTSKSDDVMDLGVLDGSLCLVVRAELDDASNVWVMEYGVKESWTKLFSISQMNVLGQLCTSPVVYNGERDELLVKVGGDSSGLFWFNLNSKTLKSVDHFISSPDAIVCRGSLVPLPSIEGSPVSDYFQNKDTQ